MNNSILIATNGFEGTWPAIEYGAWAASAIDADVVLLGVLEEEGQRSDSARRALDELIGRAAALFDEKHIRYSVERREGRCEEIIALESLGTDGLTVLGPLGRPFLRRLIVGRSIRSLLEDIPTPVLYVPRACLPLKKMLVCIGGLGYEVTAEHLAVRLGAAAGAEATLLHVAPPVDLDYPTARAEREHWKDLVTTDTLPGRNLRRALETARASGLSATVKARQGNVVEEILEEMKTGQYDLICMGSAHGVNGLRQLYAPNVTDEVAEQARCPVLTARYVPEAEKAGA
jgi:nucleotide-binding universal stress UspA family protein